MKHVHYYVEPHNPIKRWPLLVIIVGVVLSVAVSQCAVAPIPAFAHDDAILNCSNNVLYSYVKKLDERRIANGLLDEHYDSNKDGIIDIHVLSSITGASDEGGFTPHKPDPVFWIVDLDLDGRADMVYVDKHGEGNCDDIVPYQDLNEPQLRGDDPVDPFERKRDTDLDRRRM